MDFGRNGWVMNQNLVRLMTWVLIYSDGESDSGVR